MDLKSHPTSDQLERFVLGRTGAEENQTIVRHLLASCPECRKVTRALEEIRTMRRHPMTREIREELESVRRRFLELLAPLQTPEGASRDASTDQERLRGALWAAVRGLEPLLTEAQLPSELDLTKDDPATQRILHDFVVREYFSPHLLDDPGDMYVPGYTPEECELRVFFQFGRWFVSWMKLEEDMNRPEALTRELLVFDRGNDNRFVFTEV